MNFSPFCSETGAKVAVAQEHLRSLETELDAAAAKEEQLSVEKTGELVKAKELLEKVRDSLRLGFCSHFRNNSMDLK